MTKRRKKLLTGLLIASISVLSISTPVFASTNTASTKIPILESYKYDANIPIPGITVDNTKADNTVSVKAWWPDNYIVTSKVKNGTARHITKYITANWAKASSYTLAKGESSTYGLQIGGSADFAKAIKASGAFTASKTFTSTVSTTIPADSKRFSKLTYQCDYNRYSATVYKVPAHNDNLPTQPANVLVGTDTVDEPTNVTYAIVVYK